MITALLVWLFVAVGFGGYHYIDYSRCEICSDLGELDFSRLGGSIVLGILWPYIAGMLGYLCVQYLIYGEIP